MRFSRRNFYFPVIRNIKNSLKVVHTEIDLMGPGGTFSLSSLTVVPTYHTRHEFAVVIKQLII